MAKANKNLKILSRSREAECEYTDNDGDSLNMLSISTNDLIITVSDALKNDIAVMLPNHVARQLRDFLNRRYP